MNKYLALIILLIILLTAVPTKACVGARALGMGGAFIVPADNSSAVYWNQAGLTEIDGHQLSYTRLLNNRKQVNYDDFFALAGNFSRINLGYGLFHVREDFVYYQEDGINETGYQRWYGLALARQLGDDFALGTAARLVRHQEENDYSDAEPEIDTDLSLGIDLSARYQITEQLLVGVLIQNIRNTEFELEQGDFTYGTRFRPGMSYQVTDFWQLAFSVYDFKDFRYQLGTELNLNDTLYIRGGSYLDNPTVGFGLEIRGLRVDYAWLGGDLAGSNLLEVSYQF